MAKPRRARPSDPMPVEEKLGHVWAGLYVSLIVALVVVLVGKACLFGG